VCEASTTRLRSCATAFQGATLLTDLVCRLFCVAQSCISL